MLAGQAVMSVWGAAVLVAVLAVSSSALAAGELVNEDVSREISLRTHLCTVTTTINAKNTGSSTVKVYALPEETGVVGKLSYVAAESSKGADLDVSSEGVAVNIGAGRSFTFTLKQIFTHCQAAFPAKIKQNDAQKVVFEGSAYFSSAYNTKSQTTRVHLAGDMETHTKVKPTSISGSTITYGPYTNVAAGAVDAIRVHFENHSPFLTTRKYVREIMVSHWGHASIQEDISVYHSGAELTGEFSRFEFSRLPEASRTAIQSWSTSLHAAAEDVYYRDVVGNISTSNLRVERDQVVLEVTPRFPIMGGWRTEYTVGYSLPSGEILDHAGDTYRMTTRFVGHIYDDQDIEEAEVRVVLPEGAFEIEVETPFSVDSEDRDVKVTYFDTTGRPVVVLRKSNLVEEHMQDFSVTYKMPAGSVVREPVMAIGFFAVLFFAAIVLNRIDVSIKAKSS